MTGSTGDLAAKAADGEFARDWQAVRADDTIQFATVKPLPPQEIPEWLQALGRWLSDLLRPVGEAINRLAHMIGISAQALLWALAAVGAVIAVLIVWRIVRHLRLRGRVGRREDETEWSPNSEVARNLLEEADGLAGEGRFGEATHLLLLRSVEQIAAARPGLLEPSSTAREIASAEGLSAAAQAAFAAIAERVERSLFALRQLSQSDWESARAAYAEFAHAAPRERA